MALMDAAVWRGKIYSGGWVDGAAATPHTERAALPTVPADVAAQMPAYADEVLDAFTDTRWVTIRGDIAPYPF